MLKKKNLGQFSKNYRTFYPKKLSLSSQKYEFGIRDPGSGIRKKPIPDPGSRGPKDTGSRMRNTDCIGYWKSSKRSWKPSAHTQKLKKYWLKCSDHQKISISWHCPSKKRGSKWQWWCLPWVRPSGDSWYWVSSGLQRASKTWRNTFPRTTKAPAWPQGKKDTGKIKDISFSSKKI
jgi:hypothetical protein